MTSEKLALLPSVGVVLAGLAFTRDGERRWLIVSGVCGALAALFKPTALASTVALSLFLLLDRRGVRPLIWLWAPLAAVLGLVWVAFTAVGAGAQLIDAVIAYNIARFGFQSERVPGAALSATLDMARNALGVVWLLALAAIPIAWRTSSGRLLVLWAVLDVAALFLGGNKSHACISCTGPEHVAAGRDGADRPLAEPAIPRIVRFAWSWALRYSRRVAIVSGAGRASGRGTTTSATAGRRPASSAWRRWSPVCRPVRPCSCGATRPSSTPCPTDRHRRAFSIWSASPAAATEPPASARRGVRHVAADTAGGDRGRPAHDRRRSHRRPGAEPARMSRAAGACSTSSITRWPSRSCDRIRCGQRELVYVRSAMVCERMPGCRLA